MTRDRKVAVFGLAAIAVLFCTVRVPVMYRQPGGYDEDFYAVPGLTILSEGIPRLPHVPARNPESAFYMAERVLFSEPPLYFYLQAAFYSFLPHVYGSARLLSGIAGLLLITCVYRLARLSGAGTVAALAAAGLLSISRWFYFPATCARPDVLCGLFGILAILIVLRWLETPRTSTLILAGICLGLGGLTHFFAIIYAVQLAIVVAIGSRGWGRLLNPALLAVCAVLTFSIWLPMIAIAPEAFRMQIGNQFGGEAGGPLWQRALLPFKSMSFQIPMMWGHIGPVQWLLPGSAVLWCMMSAGARRQRVLLLTGCLAGSSIYLICVLVGVHHPVIGYWVYPAGLMFACLACGLQRLAEIITARLRRSSADAPGAVRTQTAIVAVGAVFAGLALLPGCGLRTWLVHLRHWTNINYDAPRFARKLIDELPPDAVCAVDAPYILDFVAAGRPTLKASTYPPYFRVDQFQYDRLIVSRHAIDERLAQRLEARLIRAEGVEEDRFACYVEIYAPAGASTERLRDAHSSAFPDTSGAKSPL